MQIDKVEIDAATLALIDNQFGSTRPRYTKSVTINYTDGKQNDSRWGTERLNALGRVNPQDVVVDEATRHCRGSCLIDLTALMWRARTPAGAVGRVKVPASLSPRSLRYLVVITVVHELMHIDQGWQIGKRFARDMLDEKTSAASRAHDYAQVNMDMPDDPYLQNLFEAGARDFVARWVAQCGERIHAGEFDFLLPTYTMRGLFADVPGFF